MLLRGLAKARPDRVRLEQLEQQLEAVASEVRGGDGAWELDYRGVHMACLTDPRFDRMRLIAPIVELDEVGPEEMDAMMRANFHTALDGRYAISGDTVYAAFIHPLSPLTEEELSSALDQVAHLVSTYGEEFTSGALHFGPGRSESN